MVEDPNEQEIKSEEEKQIQHEKNLEDVHNAVNSELQDLSKNTEDELDRFNKTRIQHRLRLIVS